MLTREKILNTRNDLKKKKVEVPEWGGDIYVQEFSGETRDYWDQYISPDKNEKSFKKNVRATLIVLTVVDEKGNRIFEDSDIDSVGCLSGNVLSKIHREALKINGLLASDVEDAKGNSKAA